MPGGDSAERAGGNNYIVAIYHGEPPTDAQLKRDLGFGWRTIVLLPGKGQDDTPAEA